MRISPFTVSSSFARCRSILRRKAEGDHRAQKDIDCMGTVNMAHIYAGSREGYPPCTPQAVVELLDFYGIDVSGKKVTIVGAA